MILDATTKTIEVVLEGAITTNQLDVTSGFADSFPGGAFLPGEQDTSTNGATPVTAVSAPASNVQRMVNEVRVYNKDTVIHTVTIQLNDNGTRRVLQKEPVSPGAVVLYAPGGGTLTDRAPLDFIELESGSTPVKISAFAVATTPLAGTELVPIVQGGANKRTTPDAFLVRTGNITIGGVQLELDLDNSGSPNIVAGTGVPIYITSAATTGATNSQFADLISGNVSSGSGNSGEVDVGSGTTDSGTSGPVFIFSGDSASGDSGDVNYTSGNAPGGTSGMANFGTAPGKASGHAGFSTGDSTAGNTGDITLVTGNATGGNSGSITIQIGSASGTVGNLLIVNLPTSSAGLPANAIWCDTGAANVLKRV